MIKNCLAFFKLAFFCLFRSWFQRAAFSPVSIINRWMVLCYGGMALERDGKAVMGTALQSELSDDDWRMIDSAKRRAEAIYKSYSGIAWEEYFGEPNINWSTYFGEGLHGEDMLGIIVTVDGGGDEDMMDFILSKMETRKKHLF